jgi:hypothetical protein
MIAAGYTYHRGNQNRLASLPEVVARVDAIRKASDDIVDLRKLDRGRMLIELARIAFANVPLRAAIANDCLGAAPVDQPALHVIIRLDGVLAKHIEMRLLDDRGAFSGMLHYNGPAAGDASLDFGAAVPPDHESFEQVLRALLRNREQPTSQEK